MSVQPKPRLLILNPTCLEVIEAHRTHLDQSGVDWVADSSFMSLKPADIDSVLKGANALILPSSIRTLPSAEQMQRHSSLKVLSIAASGFDWLDVDAATARGIVVTFAPIREGSETVADLALGLMLAVARQIPHYHQEICAGRYGRGMGVTLWGKTLGIVGLGRIGRAVAKRAAGFDMRILAVEPSPDAAFVKQFGVQIVNLQTLLRESDFVSLHVRLDQHTERMMGAKELALMKPSAFLINTARQQLVDENALADAILKGRLAGAGLDDPPTRPDYLLCGLPNVVFAPHHGNRTVEGVHAVFRCAIDNALAVLAGRRPELVVNPEVYKRLTATSADSIKGRNSDYTISRNSISFQNGKTVTFDFDIKETSEFGGILVVLLNVPAKQVMTENVFGVSLDGEIQWQIESIPETSTNKWDKWNAYMNIRKAEAGCVRVGNWKGWEVDVDITTGRVLKKAWFKQ